MDELRTGLPPFVINIVVLDDTIHRSLYLPSTLCHILNIYVHACTFWPLGFPIGNNSFEDRTNFSLICELMTETKK